MKKKEEKHLIKNEKARNIVSFVGRTLLYSLILLVLIYLYQYSHVKGGGFIYNEF